MSIFSERLKHYREKLKITDKKWTQQYVADKIGVARVTYTAYENGTKMPPFDTINNIADLFNIKTDYLMGRSDHPLLTKKEDERAESKYPEVEKMLDSLPDKIREETLSEILAYAKIKANANKEDDED